MTKPEGISDEAWEAAIRAEGGNNPGIVANVARTIQSSVEAERERCASIAEDHHDDDGTELECQGCGEVIAERIRKGA